MGPSLCLLQIKLRSAYHHFMAMIDIVLYKVLQVEGLGPAFNQGYVVYAKA